MSTRFCCVFFLEKVIDESKFLIRQKVLLMGEGLTQDVKLYLISCMRQFINTANRKDVKTQKIGEVDSL